MSQNQNPVYDITSGNIVESGMTIRKVTLEMNEDFNYQTIKLLVDTNGNKKAASLSPF